jgi:hypothetical protein
MPRQYTGNCELLPQSKGIGCAPRTQTGDRKYPMDRAIPAKTQYQREREAQNLHERYGKIGISAVAAALPYQSDAKNPAYAPVVPRDWQWRDEAA